MIGKDLFAKLCALSCDTERDAHALARGAGAVVQMSGGSVQQVGMEYDHFASAESDSFVMFGGDFTPDALRSFDQGESSPAKRERKLVCIRGA